MDHIQALLDLSKDYWSLAMIVGLLSCFIESFLPILPLVAIVGANAMIFGLWGGFIISWIGSGLGTLALFLLIRKYNNNKLFKKIKSKKIEKAILWMNRQGFKLLFIAYSCPFVPSFLVTITSAFCKKEVSEFLPAMLAGKFVMFLVICYPASDLGGFLRSPMKIALFIILVFLSWKIGSKVNTDLEQHKYNHK